LSPQGYNSPMVRCITHTNFAQVLELKAPLKEHLSLPEISQVFIK